MGPVTSLPSVVIMRVALTRLRGDLIEERSCLGEPGGDRGESRYLAFEAQWHADPPLAGPSAHHQRSLYLPAGGIPQLDLLERAVLAHLPDRMHA